MPRRGHFVVPLLALFLCGTQAPAPQKSETPFNPYRAEKSVEIGQFYMKKGKYDAAIERFQDAIRNRTNFALPHRLLGEAYEKKGMKAEAVEYYRKYLEILPAAADADKIRGRIARLQRTLDRETARRKRGSPT